VADGRGSARVSPVSGVGRSAPTLPAECPIDTDADRPLDGRDDGHDRTADPVLSGCISPVTVVRAGWREVARAVCEPLTALTLPGDCGCASPEAPPPLSRTVTQGAAGPTLVRTAQNADYLVVGTAHKSLAKRTMLGSVSQYCVLHSSVPVVVVPQGADAAPAGTQGPHAADGHSRS
jgi:hypothetical protein